jgi:glucose/arabinose dehydrogenase
VRRAAVRLAGAAVLTTLALTACVAVDPATPPGGPQPTPDLFVRPVVGNLSQPWDIAFLPVEPHSMLFTEKGGDISVFRDGAKQIIHRPTDVAVEGEGGMMGLAVDPRWGTNRFLYVCMLTASDVRVVRFTTTADLTGVTARADIVTGMPRSSGRHSGCRVRFGPDGQLWIATGDAAQGTHPQDLESLGGKVLRVGRNGVPAPGNPALGGDPRIYTYGHRNVQGLAFRPGTAQAFSVEHGPECNDEVNRLVAGANYGWDPVPGYNERVPMTDLAKFPSAREASWSSGCPTIAPSGATFLDGPQWEGWDGALALAVLKDRHLRVLFLDGSGDAVTFEQAVMNEFNTRLRSAVQGPDGTLYVATDVGGGGGIIQQVIPS